MDCLNKEDTINNGGEVIENDNGTVSVYYSDGNVLVNSPLTKFCCELLDSSYIWDANKQLCKWDVGCDNPSPFKVVLNPNGNDGVIFSVDQTNQETCTLNISFDYLFQMDCDDIISKIREANDNTELNELQLQYDNCISELTAYKEEMNQLILQLELTPYVIICDNDINNESNCPTPTNLLTGLNQFCLTEAGLQQWEIILGATRYQAWVISNGVDTTQYTCVDVTSLDAIDNGSGTLFSTCDISITERQEIINRLEELRRILLLFNCDDILAQINELYTPCSNVSEILESLDVSMTLELINPDTGDLQTVYEEEIFNIGSGNITNYLTRNQPNTGIRFSCDTTNQNCSIIGRLLMTEIAQQEPTSGTTEIQELVENSFDSDWLNFQTRITNQDILDLIYNQEIKISFKIKNCCVDFAILVDRIKMNRDCSKLDSVELSFTKSPSFELVRTLDNKKSWMTNEDFKRREFDLKFRDTQYDINQYKLAINTKEVDLDINPANAIEQDLFCYVRDNDCILKCLTATTFTCPTGKIFNETESDCFSITYTETTLNGTPYTATTGDVSIGVYNRYGAVFLGNVYDRPWPLQFSGSSDQFGVYSGTNFVVDATNEVVNAEYGGVGTGLTYYSPASISNSLWGDAIGGGRMNNAGIKTSAPIGSWVGLSYCIDVPFDGSYQVGLGSDELFRFKVNGQSVFEQMNPITTLSPYPPYSLFNNHFWIFGLNLNAGKNIIEIEYQHSGTSGNLTAEIYTATTTELAAMTTYSELSGVTIFTTANFVGEEFQLNDTNGYSCPTGYALDTCIPIPYKCAKIERENPIDSSECLSCEPTSATTCCGDIGIDINTLLSTNISGITNLDEFRGVISSELIDVKGWKTQTSYPTLRLLYDRYINSVDYCGNITSQFNYLDMIKFSELIGVYWVDLIEQVIPSTTIWGSTYVYGNTIFDQQKFKYKKYSLFGCQLPTYSGDVVSPTSGWTDIAQIEWVTIPNDNTIIDDTITGTTGTTATTRTSSATEVTSPFADINYRGCDPDGQDPTLDNCIGVGIIQINCGSEFVGRIVDYGESGDDGGGIVISECSISVDITDLTETSLGVYSVTASVGGDVTGTIYYLWSDGQTTQTAVGLTNGLHTVTVFDNGITGCSASAEIRF